MEVAGRVVEGRLEERGRAREQYDEAVAAGQRAAIAEEERPGVFTLRAGNLMPGEAATVELTYCGILPYSDGEVTFRFPLVVAPRYIPGRPLPGPSVGDDTAPDTDAVPDASRITPPVLLPGFPNPVQLALELELYDATGAVATLAEALQLVHECGMVHGDVTASNIFPDGANRPHLAGFAWPILAVCADRPELTADGMMLGTAGYVAPELLAGGAKANPVDPRRDVYALGVVLYERLTGHKPFQGTLAKIVRQVTTTDPRFPRLLKPKPTIPQELEAICLKALARDPGARYASAGALAEALRVFLGTGASSQERRRGFWK